MKVWLLAERLTLDFRDIINSSLLFETALKIEIGVPFKYNGKCYNVRSIRHKDNIACVQEFVEKEKECNFEREVTCPYCGTSDSDSWERGDSEDEEILRYIWIDILMGARSRGNL